MMIKSEYLETLEKLQNALIQFDMSFGVSNRIFRLALVSEIIDTTCLFEQLYESWCEHLPFGEGPDADVDFTYWKDYNSWDSLLNNANQNACIDDYPIDMGNGFTSDKVNGNRRKNYLKSLNKVLRLSEYLGKDAASSFVKTINSNKTHMMTFGNMVYQALVPLLLTFSKIETHLAAPPYEMFSDYFEQQRGRFSDKIDDAFQKIRDIMCESISEKRKKNRLKEMKDDITKALRKSGFLTDLKRAYTHYDIDDYRNENNCPHLNDDIVLEYLVLEDLLTDDMQFDRKKIAKHIYEHRKTMSLDTIASFYVYAEVIPEIERRLVALKGYDSIHDANATQSQKSIGNKTNLSASRQSILNQLMYLSDKGDWASGVTADDVKAILRMVLGQSNTPLNVKEAELSEKLWKLLESGRGERVKIVWQNLVGYLDEKKLFRQKGSPALNKDFFGDEDNYSNIDKGRPSRDNMSAGFRDILPLLDAYVPKVG